MAEYDITEAGGKLIIVADKVMIRLKEAGRLSWNRKQRSRNRSFRRRKRN